MSDYEVLTTDKPNAGRLKWNAALEVVTYGGVLQRTSVPVDTTATILADHQLIVYGNYTVYGTLVLEGELIVL
jgi:hypothetical protein